MPLCQRLHVFLFELALVLTRPGEDRELGQVFHVYRQPLRNALINLEEIPDGEAAGGGTFRGAFTGGNDKGSTSQEYLTYSNVNIFMLSNLSYCILQPTYNVQQQKQCHSCFFSFFC